jgi:hypothetical protein
VATYARLLEAQERIAQACSRAGATDAAIDDALAASEPSDPEALSDRELYLGTLARFVAVLGGRLEVSAVFPDETVTLPGEPGAG